MAYPANPSILIVDDDVGFVRAAAEIARSLSYDVTVAGTVEQASARLDRTSFDLTLLDLSLPDGSGLDLIEHCDVSRTQVVIVTGHPTVESAITALRTPFLDYLVKPIDPAQYRKLLERAAQERALPPLASGDNASWHGLVGRSEALRHIVSQIERVGPTDASVLIQGESGVGKELVAHAIHATSARKGEFVVLNCGAVAPDLLASQLFGHERGSFTGASSRHNGFFEQAQGGTLFLDEITEMPLHLQVHLLRALENRTIRRVGDTEDISINVRIVAATNMPLPRALAEGRLREDLFYRLGEFPIMVPPLRERPEDIEPLANLFLSRLNERYGAKKAFSVAALQRLEHFPWPGNIRELRNVIGHAFIMAQDNVICDPLSDVRIRVPLDETPSSLTVSVGMTFDEIERRLLFKALKFYNDDKTRTAKALGISVKTIYNRLARYQLDEVDANRTLGNR